MGFRIRRPVAVAFAAILLTGCNNEPFVWTKNFSFESEEWEEIERVTFVPDSVFVESTSARKGVLNFRYGADSNVEDFFMAVETDSPAVGSYSSDTVLVKLLPIIDRNGANATAGVFETSDTLHFNSEVKPGWEMTIYPLTGIKKIEGLISVTLTLIE